MVVSAHPSASDARLEMLRKGGIDALTWSELKRPRHKIKQTNPCGNSNLIAIKLGEFRNKALDEEIMT